jgi:hypothetical protein
MSPSSRGLTLNWYEARERISDVSVVGGSKVYEVDDYLEVHDPDHLEEASSTITRPTGGYPPVTYPPPFIKTLLRKVENCERKQERKQNRTPKRNHPLHHVAIAPIASITPAFPPNEPHHLEPHQPPTASASKVGAGARDRGSTFCILLPGL